eukprot:444326-Amphidinium_carterae.1
MDPVMESEPRMAPFHCERRTLHSCYTCPISVFSLGWSLMITNLSAFFVASDTDTETLRAIQSSL